MLVMRQVFSVQVTQDNTKQHRVMQACSAYSFGLLLFLMLHLTHQCLCLIILAGHDVADTEICQDNSRHIQQVLKVALHQGLIEANGLLESPICSIKATDLT